jgi:transposase
MSYSIDLRQKVVEFLSKGNSQRKATEVFGICLDTVSRWYQKYRDTGSLANKPLERSFKKIDPDKLSAYVEEHPGAYLSELAEVFSCSDVAILKALRRLGITRKKN